MLQRPPFEEIYVAEITSKDSFIDDVHQKDTYLVDLRNVESCIRGTVDESIRY